MYPGGSGGTETKSKVAKFLSIEKSNVSKATNPFVGGESSEGMNVHVIKLSCVSAIFLSCQSRITYYYGCT